RPSDEVDGDAPLRRGRRPIDRRAHRSRIRRQGLVPASPYASRVAAAEALLDRGWGKPKQSHEAEITHRYVIEIPALMDNATWEAEGLERLEPPGKTQGWSPSPRLGVLGRRVATVPKCGC